MGGGVRPIIITDDEEMGSVETRRSGYLILNLWFSILISTNGLGHSQVVVPCLIYCTLWWCIVLYTSTIFSYNVLLMCYDESLYFL